MAIKIEEPTKNLDQDSKKDIVIGIDLGTTNSLVAIIENNQPKLLGNDEGNIFPSLVCFDSDGEFAGVGKVFENSILVSSIKRLMGKSFEDLKDINFDFEISPDNGLSIKIANKYYRPEEISAFILKYLKEIAEKNLGKDVNKCVLTVPAYFDEAAKNATKHAAMIAGLEVLRLVNEPTAAALAYGLDTGVEGQYLVYDFGGGTFDVSLLKMQGGVFRVLGVSGDNELGGDDIDRLLMARFSGIDKYKAKQIKEQFANQDNLLIDGKEFKIDDFNKIINPVIDKTIDLTCGLIEDLEIDNDEINGVILVGGSTRIRLIRQSLANIFGQKKVFTNLDPDRVVAIGAAWQAFNLSGGGNNLLLDVVPLSLGVEMMGGIVDKIIYRNSSTPCAYAKEFTTYADNQTGMKFHIVQGERELAKDCRSLANFEIKNILPMKAGMAKILVTFKVDADGLLTVSAKDQKTDQQQEIIVKPSYSLDESKIKEILLDSLKNSKSDIEKRLKIELINEAKKDISIIKNDLENSPELVDDDEKKLIISKISELENLISNDFAKDKIEKSLSEFREVTENLVLNKVNKVLNSKISGQKIDDMANNNKSNL